MQESGGDATHFGKATLYSSREPYLGLPFGRLSRPRSGLVLGAIPMVPTKLEACCPGNPWGGAITNNRNLNPLLKVLRYLSIS